MQSCYRSFENFSSHFCPHKMELQRKKMLLRKWLFIRYKKNVITTTSYLQKNLKSCMVINIVQKIIRSICVVSPSFCAYSNRFWTFLVACLIFTCKFIMVDCQNCRFSSCDIRTTVFRKIAQPVKEQVVVVTQVTPLIRNLVWQVVALLSNFNSTWWICRNELLMLIFWNAT